VHYEGGCFVFDERRAVDIELESLKPKNTKISCVI